MRMQDEFLKKYFLGLLDPEDIEKIELQMLEDSEFEHVLSEAENDLTESYLENNLTDSEIEAFGKNFLITDERRDRVEFLRLLKIQAQGSTETEAEKPTLFERLAALFALRPIAVVFGLVVLLTGLGIGWRLIFDVGRNGIDADVIALNQKDLSDLTAFKNSRTLSLAPGNLRSPETANTLSTEALTDLVLIRLALPVAANSEQNFTVRIFKEGQILQTLVQRPVQNQELRLVLPKALLGPGEYQITLEKDGGKFSYYFSVR